MSMLVGNHSTRATRAVDAVARHFESKQWTVRRASGDGPLQPDLVIKKGRRSYVVEVKSLSESRADRVIPLLSQAILQAQAISRESGRAKPLAVVYVGAVSPALLAQVEKFVEIFAPDSAIGVVAEGAATFFGDRELDSLTVAPPEAGTVNRTKPLASSNLFSDVNQWMLKVLLAPEVQPALLSAPRSEYRNVSELAAAAGVSVMSAFRFATQLREEGFLDESATRMRLVRRETLFRRWKATALRHPRTIKMSFLIPGQSDAKLRKFVLGADACLGYFAAASALHLGHVAGVQPYVYVHKLPVHANEAWHALLPAESERSDIVLVQSRTPRSVFGAAVTIDKMRVCDVFQIWLDVSAHPSRGKEQADVIERKVLQRVIGAAE